MRHENNEHTGGAWHRGHGKGRGKHSGETKAGGNPHRGHGGHSRQGRFFEHGDLRLVALQLIAEKPRHGYEIIKAIEEKSGGAYTPSAGAVYPTLTLLQELGQLTVTDGAEGRKLHTITEEGAAALVANRKTVEAVFARIAQAGASTGSAPLIDEAFHRLKHSLRLRLAQGSIDEAQVRNIADKLNDVSDAIAQS